MKRSYDLPVLTFVVMGSLVMLTPVAATPAPDPPAGTIEIVIRNKTYEFHGGTLRPDQPTEVVLRNQDEMEHGFNSKLFQELEVQVETRDAVTFGKSIKGVHISPGSSISLHFRPTHAGKFRFQCDLHPDMKGELYMLEIPTA